MTNEQISSLIKSIAGKMAKTPHAVYGNTKRTSGFENPDNKIISDYINDITESTRFREWFAGSQLVMDDGSDRPLLLFHGDYNEFRSDHDTWFSTKWEVANAYGDVTACFVNAKKVFNFDANGNSWTNIPIDLLKDDEDVHSRIYPYDDEYPNDTSVNDIVHAAVDAGYDAAWIRNVDDDHVADQIFVKAPVDMWKI